MVSHNKRIMNSLGGNLKTDYSGMIIIKTVGSITVVKGEADVILCKEKEERAEKD